MITKPSTNVCKLALATLYCIAVVAVWHPQVAAQTGQANQTHKTISTNLTGFTVPFEIEDEQGIYIEVHLYVSDDQGKNWKFYAKRNVADKGFPFKADGDGEYWFALKTLDRNRQFVPPGNIVRPELSIVVDTKKPKLQLSAESDAAGRVITSWKIVDSYIDSSSLNLSYRNADLAEEWQPIQLSARSNSNGHNYTDRIAWWPKTNAGRIEIKLEVADTAGNTATQSQYVTLQKTAYNRNRTGSSTTQQNRWTAAKKSTNKPANNQWTQKSKSNIVCKDGVCEVVDSPNVASSNKNNGSRQRNQYIQPRQPTRNQIAARQIGSRAEYIAPPEPYVGFNAQQSQQASVRPKFEQPKSANEQTQLANGPAEQKTAPSESIVWNSQSSQWNNKATEQSASTLDQNQYQTKRPANPALSIEQSIKNAHAITQMDSDTSPQPPTTPNQTVTESSNTRQGDLVVSQSTAYGRGKPLNQNSSPIPKTDRDIPATNQRQFNPRSNQTPHQLVSNPNKRPGTVVRKFIPPINDLPADTLNINTRRFNLNYDIRAIDTSGVGRVTLWATRDGGTNWKSWAVDPDNISPFPVEVSDEGFYGFRVVINSKDGLTGKPPSSGDRPDVWVQVDLSVPKVALTSAPFGSGRDVGKLVIHWEAYDAAFGDRPIKLSYSPNSQGPWTTIRDRLRNTGSYAWKVPKQVPEQIFLRIEAKDTAKNIGIYQLTQPIDISGLVPRGRIYGVDPIR